MPQANAKKLAVKGGAAPRDNKYKFTVGSQR
jgi:hypothetical protein